MLRSAYRCVKIIGAGCALVFGSAAIGGAPGRSLEDLKQLDRVARCLIVSASAASTKLATAKPSSNEQREQAKALTVAQPRCWSGKPHLVDLPPVLLAGALAQQRFGYDHDGFSSRIVSRTADFVDVVTSAAAVKRRSGPVFNAAAAADCIMTLDVQAGYRLMRSKRGSAAESRLFDSVAGLISPCIEAGQKVAFDRATLRAEVAIAFLRHLYAIQSAPLQTDSQ